MHSGRILLGLAEKLRGGRSLARLKEIGGTPFLTPAGLEALRVRMLRDLLSHAESKVPYYRELFRSLAVTSRDFRSLADLERLPILTKDIVRARQQDLIREDVDRSKLSTHHSGGSTGVPLTFFREPSYMDYSKAAEYRAYMQCGWRPGDMIAFFWGGSDKLYSLPSWQFEVRQRLRRAYQLDPFFSGPEEMDRWMKKWGSIAPVIGAGYASTIARFAEHVESRGARIPALKGVFTTAEKLYPQQRAVIERVFQCHVFDFYGSSEVQAIAAECPQGGMHVQGDFVIVEKQKEVQPKDGATPFLVTSLRNYAMPFIRYRNEDCGDLIETPCSCGNGFPLLDLRISRVSDNLRLPSGRIVHGEYFTHLMYGTQGIATFQFHQIALDHIVVWVVPVEGLAEERAAAVRGVIDHLRTLDAPHTLQVEVRETDAIPLSGAGKHRFVRTDVPADPS
jgi:phenylacetate-CoA ligase